MKKIVTRLKREPIISRIGLAAVLNVLVVAGVIDTGAAESVEGAVLAVISAATILSARSRVTPLQSA
jgi:hypothetical protein